MIFFASHSSVTSVGGLLAVSDPSVTLTSVFRAAIVTFGAFHMIGSGAVGYSSSRVMAPFFDFSPESLCPILIRYLFYVSYLVVFKLF